MAKKHVTLILLQVENLIIKCGLLFFWLSTRHSISEPIKIKLLFLNSIKLFHSDLLEFIGTHRHTHRLIFEVDNTKKTQQGDFNFHTCSNIHTHVLIQHVQLKIRKHTTTVGDMQARENTVDSPFVHSPLSIAVFVIDAMILLASAVANCFALQGAMIGEFGFACYRRFLISLLISDLYIVGVHSCQILFQILSMQEPHLFIFQSIDSMSNDVSSAAAGQSLSSGSLSIEISECLVVAFRRLAIVGICANLLNFCAMSTDHFVKLIFPLNYNTIMSHLNVTTALVIIWICSIIFAFLDLPLVPFLNSNEATPNEIDKATTNANSTSSSSPFSPFQLSTSFANELSASQLHCDRLFSPYANLWLESAVLILSLSALAFLGITCGIVFCESGVLGNQISRTKRKLGRLVTTTFCLMTSFCIWFVRMFNVFFYLF